MTMNVQVKCRRCRLHLLSQNSILTSHSGNVHGASEDWDCGGLPATQLFISMETAPPWLTDALVESSYTQGKILCPKCQGRLGSFDFLKTSRKCGCGKSTLPPVHVMCNRVDILDGARQLPVAVSAMARTRRLHLHHNPDICEDNKENRGLKCDNDREMGEDKNEDKGGFSCDDDRELCEENKDKNGGFSGDYGRELREEERKENGGFDCNGNRELCEEKKEENGEAFEEKKVEHSGLNFDDSREPFQVKNDQHSCDDNREMSDKNKEEHGALNWENNRQLCSEKQGGLNCGASSTKSSASSANGRSLGTEKNSEDGTNSPISPSGSCSAEGNIPANETRVENGACSRNVDNSANGTQCSEIRRSEAVTAPHSSSDLSLLPETVCKSKGLRQLTAKDNALCQDNEDETFLLLSASSQNVTHSANGTQSENKANEVVTATHRGSDFAELRAQVRKSKRLRRRAARDAALCQDDEDGILAALLSRAAGEGGRYVETGGQMQTAGPLWRRPPAQPQSVASRLQEKLDREIREEAGLAAEELSEDHTCPMCLDVMISPHRTSPCKHNFCEGCLRRLSTVTSPTATSCPLCRRNITACHPNTELWEAVSRLSPLHVAARLRHDKRQHRRRGRPHAPLPTALTLAVRIRRHLSTVQGHPPWGRRRPPACYVIAAGAVLVGVVTVGVALCGWVLSLLAALFDGATELVTGERLWSVFMAGESRVASVSCVFVLYIVSSFLAKYFGVFD